MPTFAVSYLIPLPSMLIQATKDEVEEDLAEAMPVLYKALAALDTLSPKDITEIKAMKKPPMPVSEGRVARI